MEKNKQKINEKLKRFFNRAKNNWKMKGLSIFLAILLWNSIIENTDPIISRTTEAMPVTIIGAEQLISKGFAIATETKDYLEKVKVTVLMNRSQSKLFDQNNIQVTLDLSRITTAGEQSLKLTAYTSEGDIEKITPNSFTVVVDERKSKIVQIEYDIVGQLPEGYFAGEILVEPTSLQITGPSSMVDKVESARFTIDMTNRVTSLIVPKELKLVDKDNTPIVSDTLITSVSSAMFEMKVMPRKEIHVIGENCVSGIDKLPEGYEVDEIEVYPSTVEVTGSTEMLEGLTSLPSEVIDVAGKSEDVYTTIRLLAPEGITIQPDTVSMIIRISEIMEKAEFENQRVELRNIPRDMRVIDFSQVRNLSMMVPYNTIYTLTRSHVKLYIDLADLEEGAHELKIQCEVPEEFRSKDIIIDNDTAIVEMVSRN